MRILACSAAIFALSATVAFAQSVPDRGTFNAGTYENKTLGITWQIPAGWSSDSGGSSASSILGSEFVPLVRLLPSGAQSAELVELDFPSVREGANLAGALEERGWQKMRDTGFYTLGQGIPAHRDNFVTYVPTTRYMAVLTGSRRMEFALAAVADSASRVDELVQAVRQLRAIPDWGTVDEPTPLAPGSTPRRVRVSQGVSQAMLQHQVAPQYPANARNAHVQGSVVMSALISREGAIKYIFVLAGPEPLVPASVDAVSQWRYKPYFLNGAPVEVETQITVRFELR